MSDNSSSTSGGIGFCGLLAIAFIVLKLCKVIAWPWLWVTSPLWIPLALVFIGFVVYILYKVLYKIPNKKRRLRVSMNEYAKQFKKSKDTTPIDPLSRWGTKN